MRAKHASERRDARARIHPKLRALAAATLEREAVPNPERSRVGAYRDVGTAFWETHATPSSSPDADADLLPM